MVERLSRTESKQDHERQLIDDFVAHLPESGRSVADVAYGDAPDGTIALDDLPTSVEVGCGYANDPAELWREETIDTSNYYRSSSGNELVEERRRIVLSRRPVLVASLQARLDEKCTHRYGRSYLILDGSHDELAVNVTLDELVLRIVVPQRCGFTGTYLVEPRFRTPRRFHLLAGAS